MKVALVHDDLVQWGGAERVFLGICELFPEAPIYTSLYDDKNLLLKNNFSNKKIITSFMQKLPFWRSMYKSLLPLYPIAFEQFEFSEFDLVISNTTRFAKSIITKPKTFHLCYCHTPPRFLWNFSEERAQGALLPYASFLRIYDRISSTRVDQFLAASKNVQERIKSIYKRTSALLYPFIDYNRFKNIKTFAGDYYLIVTRLNSYKRVDLAVEVFKETGKRIKIVGTGPMLDNLMSKASRNIEFLGLVSEDMLLDLLAGCTGLITVAKEDVGLMNLEAQALGKGVIAYGEGGALETVNDGKTGVFFYDQTKDDLTKALVRFESLNINPEDCRNKALMFSKDKFLKALEKIVDQVIE